MVSLESGSIYSAKLALDFKLVYMHRDTGHACRHYPFLNFLLFAYNLNKCGTAHYVIW
jgi:hypothetical protein